MNKCDPSISFGWTYSDADGDTETEFDFQISSVPFAVPATDTCELPTCISYSQAQTLPQNAITAGFGTNGNTTIDGIDYSSKHYYWRVRVYNSEGNSGWVYYNDLTDPDGDGNPKTFTTPAHAYPYATFAPSTQTIVFNKATNKGTASFNATPAPPLPSSACYNGKSCVFGWTFGDGDTGIGSPVNHDYDSITTYNVIVDVYDSCTVATQAADCNEGACILRGAEYICSSYSCQATGTVTARKAGNVPEWREISPF